MILFQFLFLFLCIHISIHFWTVTFSEDHLSVKDKSHCHSSWEEVKHNLFQFYGKQFTEKRTHKSAIRNIFDIFFHIYFLIIALLFGPLWSKPCRQEQLQSPLFGERSRVCVCVPECYVCTWWASAKGLEPSQSSCATILKRHPHRDQGKLISYK